MQMKNEAINYFHAVCILNYFDSQYLVLYIKYIDNYLWTFVIGQEAINEKKYYSQAYLLVLIGFV